MSRNFLRLLGSRQGVIGCLLLAINLRLGAAGLLLRALSLGARLVGIGLGLLRGGFSLGRSFLGFFGLSCGLLAWRFVTGAGNRRLVPLREPGLHPVPVCDGPPRRQQQEQQEEERRQQTAEVVEAVFRELLGRSHQWQRRIPRALAAPEDLQATVPPAAEQTIQLRLEARVG